MAAIDRDEWEVDAEGNLTPPSSGELKPDTDEFGRDDPAALERERRRREREQRRKGGGEEGEEGHHGRLPQAAQARARPRAPRPSRRRRPPSVPRPRPSPPPTSAADAAPSRAGRFATAFRAAASPARPRRRAPRGRATTGRRRFAALALALVGILLVWFLVAFFQPFAGDGEGGEPVSVDIPEGASAGEIADDPRRGRGRLQRPPVRVAAEARRQVRRRPGRQLHARLGHELRRGDRPPHRRDRRRRRDHGHDPRGPRRASRSPPTCCPRASAATST